MSHHKTIAVVLVCLMALTAGCTGWGEDGPADDDDTAPDEADDLEDEQNEQDNDADADVEDQDQEDSQNADVDDSNGESDTQTPDEESEDGDAESSTSDSDDSDSDSDESSAYSEDGTDTSEESDSGTDDSDASGEQSSSTDSNGDDNGDSNGDDDAASNGDGNGDDNGDSNGDDNGETNGDEETHTLEVHAGEGIPVEGAEITVTAESETEQWDGEEWTGETNEDGVATFDVPNGEYEVQGIDNRGGEETQYVTVDGDTTAALPGLSPPAPDEHDVTISVVDANDGSPIEGAEVYAIGEFHSDFGEADFLGETDSSGEYSTTTYAGGYDLDISHEDYEDYSGSTLVEGDTEIEVELDDEEDGMYEQTLTVTVVDSNGDAVSGEEVEVGPPDEGVEQTEVTDENGQATFTSVTSVPDDATMTEIRVGDQVQGASFTVDGEHEEVQIDTDGDSSNATLAVA